MLDSDTDASDRYQYTVHCDEWMTEEELRGKYDVVKEVDGRPAGVSAKPIAGYHAVIRKTVTAVEVNHA